MRGMYVVCTYIPIVHIPVLASCLPGFCVDVSWSFMDFQLILAYTYVLYIHIQVLILSNVHNSFLL